MEVDGLRTGQQSISHGVCLRSRLPSPVDLVTFKRLTHPSIHYAALGQNFQATKPSTHRWPCAMDACAVPGHDEPGKGVLFLHEFAGFRSRRSRPAA